MTPTVISVENLSKSYRLGQIGTGTLTNDLNVWWAKLRGKPNPMLKIGQADHSNRDGETLWALRDVNFKVQQGEVLGVIGRNGAGKSTLLKILSRVTAPTGGCVKVKGRIASLLEVGTGFHPELTGRENIYLNGAILGMTKQEVTRKFDEIVAFAEVEKFIDTPVKRYSSGMYVRLAFAVAAHLESEILLVDEVLAVGDAEFQKKCLGKMGDVATNEGRTVLFVSHNMGAVKALCGRSQWFSNGLLLMNGDTDEIVEKYLNNSSERVTNSLVNRLDRVGNGDVRFIACDLRRSVDSISESIFYTGDQLVISLSLESKSNNTCYVGLPIKDSMGKTITSFNSREGGIEITLHPGLNSVVVQVPWLTLLEGRYSLDGVIVEVASKASCDRISDIATFSIFPKDVFNTGLSFRAYHGVVLVPHIWKFENDNEVSIQYQL